MRAPSGEAAGVRAGEVEPQVGRGRLGGEPLRAGRDDDAGGLAVADHAGQVGAVGQPRPQVQARRPAPARGAPAVRARRVRPPAGPGGRAAAGAGRAGAVPPGLGDDVERGGLQQPADVHRLGGPVGQDPLAGGPAGDDPRRRGWRGRRSWSASAGRRRGRSRPWRPRATGVVVMPKSCAQSSSTRKAPCARTTSSTCSRAVGRPLRAGGVGVVGLGVEQPGAGLVEGAGTARRGRGPRRRWAPARSARRPGWPPGWRPSRSATPSAAAARGRPARGTPSSARSGCRAARRRRWAWGGDVGRRRRRPARGRTTTAAPAGRRPAGGTARRRRARPGRARPGPAARAGAPGPG